MEKIVRINKYLSESGVCSRREVDELIADGRVEVNGQPARIGMQIDTERDVITVDGQKVDPSNPQKNAISQEALDELERKRNPWWTQHNEMKRQKMESKMQNPKSKLLRKKAKSGTAGERRVLRNNTEAMNMDEAQLKKAVKKENMKAKSFSDVFANDKQGLMNVKTRRVEGVNPKAKSQRKGGSKGLRGSKGSRGSRGSKG
jgi:23S rRNA-/tRNA-specific pseudouridylate synthase